MVAYPTYSLVRDSVHILMEGTPSKIDPEDIGRFIAANFQDISLIKDLHVWGLSPEKIILLVRIRTGRSSYDRAQIRMMKQLLRDQYGFADIYLELYAQSQRQIASEEDESHIQYVVQQNGS